MLFEDRTTSAFECDDDCRWINYARCLIICSNDGTELMGKMLAPMQQIYLAPMHPYNQRRGSKGSAGLRKKNVRREEGKVKKKGKAKGIIKKTLNQEVRIQNQEPSPSIPLRKKKQQTKAPKPTNAKTQNIQPDIPPLLHCLHQGHVGDWVANELGEALCLSRSLCFSLSFLVPNPNDGAVKLSFREARFNPFPPVWLLLVVLVVL